MQAALIAERLSHLKKEKDWMIERGILAGSCFSKNPPHSDFKVSIYYIYQGADF